jgi:hypothetical protein
MQVAGLVSSVLRQNSIRTENSAIPGTLDTPACELLQKQPSRKEVHAGYTPGTRRVHSTTLAPIFFHFNRKGW